MKITHPTDLSSLLPTTSSKPQKTHQHPSPRKTHSDLLAQPADRKPARRRIFTARSPRVRPRKGAAGAPAASGAGSKRAGPPTPLIRCKFDEVEQTDVGNGEKSPEGVDEVAGGGRKLRRGGKTGEAVSARKLASALWRLQASEFGCGEKRRSSSKRGDPLGFKHGAMAATHLSDRLASYHNSRVVGYNEPKDLPMSPCSVNGPVNGYICQPQSPFQLSNYAMEGATKWDPIHLEAPKKRSNDSQFLEHNNVNVSNLQAELKQAQLRIEELESERRASKKRLEHFLKKLSEERAGWRSREHEKVRAIMDDMKSDLNRERKNRQRLEMAHSKLVGELTESRQSAKRLMQEYEKERKNRELVEEVCDELAKEIGEGKAEVDALKSERVKIREGLDDERRMLQMAEVWREERVQMKLVDAKVTLEDKFAQMNMLVTEMERFLRSHGVTLDPNGARRAGMLLEVAGLVKIQDIKELTYEPPRSNDIYSVFEEMAIMAGGGTSEREIEPCVGDTPANHSSKIHTMSSEEILREEDQIYMLSNGYGGSLNGNNDDRSGWESVSQDDGDQGSSYSCDGGGSVSSISNKKMIVQSESNVSDIRWEEKRDNETLITEIMEVCPVKSTPQQQPSSKVKSVSRLWKSSHLNHSNNNDGSNNCKQQFLSMDEGGRVSNGRISNGSVVFMSPDYVPGKGGDLAGQWCSSPDTWSGGKGRKGGCIEWPRHKSSLKSKLMEARMESQKVQLRQVLKQKF